MLNPIKTITFFAALTLLAACNTMEGVGEDIESVGETIEEEAQD